MSLKALDWAIRKDLPCSRKMVLLMLANRVDEADVAHSVQRRDLASWCGLEELEVTQAIFELERHGFIAVNYVAGAFADYTLLRG